MVESCSLSRRCHRRQRHGKRLALEQRAMFQFFRLPRSWPKLAASRLRSRAHHPFQLNVVCAPLCFFFLKVDAQHVEAGLMCPTSPACCSFCSSSRTPWAPAKFFSYWTALPCTSARSSAHQPCTSSPTSTRCTSLTATRTPSSSPTSP